MNIFSRSPIASATNKKSLPQSFSEGDYLTDRRRLYRVLQIVPAKRNNRAAILEDCRTLRAALFAPKELERMRLQLVRRDPVPSMG